MFLYFCINISCEFHKNRHVKVPLVVATQVYTCYYVHIIWYMHDIMYLLHIYINSSVCFEMIFQNSNLFMYESIIVNLLTAYFWNHSLNLFIYLFIFIYLPIYLFKLFRVVYCHQNKTLKMKSNNLNCHYLFLIYSTLLLK